MTEAVGADQTLRSVTFRQERQGAWRRLDGLISRIEDRGLTTLSAEEAQALPGLYRAVMSSLSVARNLVLDRRLLLYLENLSLRAYLAVYGPRTGLWSNLKKFFRRDFPRSVRGLAWPLTIGLIALSAGSLAGYLLVLADPSAFNWLVPENLAGGRGPDSSAEELRQNELFAPWPGFVPAFVVFANALFRHNSIIGLLSFGLGFALGLPTLLLLIYNGLILGAFLALHVGKGLAVDFLGWVSVHGVTEILALLLCGAAGLAVAEKIVFPGPATRLESLARHGRRAAGVVAGAAVMFFIAGFLEGGCRQLIANTPARFALALLTAGCWAGYFLTAGREADDGPEDY